MVAFIIHGAEDSMKKMVTGITSKCQKLYSQSCGYFRARLSFFITYTTSLGLRGSRVSGLGV